MAPLAFLLSFVVAYYGPNSNIIGNVCANVWQYKKVEDINETMGTIFLFFFTDFSSVVVCAIILRVVCKINIFKAFIATEKEFGIVLCIILGYFLTTVNNGFIYCFKNWTNLLEILKRATYKYILNLNLCCSFSRQI